MCNIGVCTHQPDKHIPLKLALNKYIIYINHDVYLGWVNMYVNAPRSSSAGTYRNFFFIDMSEYEPWVFTQAPAP